MKNAEEILIEMIWLFQEYLNDIQECSTGKKDFFYGEKTAYVECLEIIQQWEKSEIFGLGYDIEKKYPL